MPLRLAPLLVLLACDGAALDTDADPGTDSDAVDQPWLTPHGDPFADAIVSFEPGPGNGFGQDSLPHVVLGPPVGGGEIGSLHVLSLGEQGAIVLELSDIGLVDGPGVDLLVFENPFVGWVETGRVAVSQDGQTWHTWPCDEHDANGGYPGCAGVERVWSTPDNGVDPTDPDEAGGDAFDLADLGVEHARYVRITDSGANTYDGETGGFDLDAIAVVNGEPLR